MSTQRQGPNDSGRDAAGPEPCGRPQLSRVSSGVNVQPPPDLALGSWNPLHSPLSQLSPRPSLLTLLETDSLTGESAQWPACTARQSWGSSLLFLGVLRAILCPPQGPPKMHWGNNFPSLSYHFPLLSCSSACFLDTLQLGELPFPQLSHKDNTPKLTGLLPGLEVAAGKGTQLMERAWPLCFPPVPCAQGTWG